MAGRSLSDAYEIVRSPGGVGNAPAAMIQGLGEAFGAFGVGVACGVGQDVGAVPGAGNSAAATALIPATSGIWTEP